jgi:hypothetical protein
MSVPLASFGRRVFFGWAAAPGGSVWWFANPVKLLYRRPDPQAWILDHRA